MNELLTLPSHPVQDKGSFTLLPASPNLLTDRQERNPLQTLFLFKGLQQF